MSLGIVVSKNIRALRLENGLSQKDLADKTGLTVRYISRLENTSPNITLEVIEKLAQGLDVAPSAILNTENGVNLSSIGISKEQLHQTIQVLQSIQSRL
jgi:transcriptional regulator with XRE-family HTH domain